MHYEKFFLEDVCDSLPAQERKTPITLYIPDVWQEVDPDVKNPCVVICPGGGYEWTSQREAEPVALRLAGSGIAAAVVDYTCCVHYPVQLLQILSAIAFMRKNSERFHIDPDRISVMGFSAGGHAACTAGIFWQEKFVADTLKIKSEEMKPNGMILCYPVITSGEFAHRGSFNALLGEDASEEMLEKMSLEKQVTENAPKAFIWHTWEDGLVPVENSLLLASALREKGREVEMHLYPVGHHGMSLCDETVDKPANVTDSARYCSGWIDNCINWVKKIL